MESNWRTNVADLGWAFSDVELAARLVTPFAIGFYVMKVGTANYTIAAYDGVPGHVAVRGADTPHGGLHFPYGLPVAAD